MKLQELYFNFEIKDKSFMNLDYHFSSDKSNKLTINSAGDQLRNIEKILDSHYNTLKEIDGNITSTMTTIGYNYRQDPSPTAKYLNTKLHYVLSTSPSGRPKNHSLRLNIIDFDPERILEVHDSIMGIPHLKFSSDAKVQVDRIDSYRSGFDARTYLNLPSD